MRYTIYSKAIWLRGTLAITNYMGVTQYCNEAMVDSSNFDNNVETYTLADG